MKLLEMKANYLMTAVLTLMLTACTEKPVSPDTQCGYFDIYGKGGKLRRLYIPEILQKEALRWLESEGRSSGYLFLNRFGKQITPRGIASQLKTFAKKYGLDEAVVYPHSFRHRFAKNFLEKRNDIALLADLMGHEHIETTRIYLRQTASEQREVSFGLFYAFDMYMLRKIMHKLLLLQMLL